MEELVSRGVWKMSQNCKELSKASLLKYLHDLLGWWHSSQDKLWSSWLNYLKYGAGHPNWGNSGKGKLKAMIGKNN